MELRGTGVAKILSAKLDEINGGADDTDLVCLRENFYTLTISQGLTCG